jgi:6-pyruvoyltetrahydropterin/6-carboxytetrahydropterin synthase
MGKFYSTKTYNTDRGLSCCFRQWKSTHSHCRFLHGYSIGVKFTFECDSLDERNWVHDFGGMVEMKQWMDYMFDHTVLIAEDDPLKDRLSVLGLETPSGKVADIRIVPAVGCERFAEMIWNKMTDIINQSREKNTLLNPSVRVKSVEVFEHGANSAIYEG